MTKKELKLLIKYFGSLIGVTFMFVGIIIWGLIKSGYIVIY